MTIQRRRGVVVDVYKVLSVVDSRGHVVEVMDGDGPHQVRAVMIPARSYKTETPGQVQINVVRMLIDGDLPDVSLWSRVDWNGRRWDVAAPIAVHDGPRSTRHWTVTLKERP